MSGIRDVIIPQTANAGHAYVLVTLSDDGAHSWTACHPLRDRFRDKALVAVPVVAVVDSQVLHERTFSWRWQASSSCVRCLLGLCDGGRHGCRLLGSTSGP
jgi:hypothetical protein